MGSGGPGAAAAAANDGALPPPDPQVFGLEGPDRDWLLRFCPLYPLLGISSCPLSSRK